jgi:SprT protein
MSKKEAPLDTLSQFLPPDTYALVHGFLHQYKVHLTITRARDTVLGDYRHATHVNNHRISVNGNLNAYAFLITLLHELAHLLTFDRHGGRVAAHGREWKHEFSLLLRQFLKAGVFPEDVKHALASSLHNPAATTCAEDDLMRVLRRYDEKREGICMVEELAPGARFMVKGGRIFRRGDKMRKRYRCTDAVTGQVYLFSPVYEVKRLD